MDVGTSIKELREIHGLTQEQLGNIAGVSAMAVSQWENSRAVPRMGSIQRIADYFGIPKSEIMGDRYEYAIARFEHSPNEMVLLEIFSKCSPAGRKRILEYSEMIAREFPNLKE